MQVVVHSAIGRYMLSARVKHSNALLRFRFERPLNLAHVQPGRELTVLECEFSSLTHTVNCRRVLESEVLLAAPAARPSLCSASLTCHF
jgi:hypothetical protein